ncbi:YdeI/OmpD-associated family protein [Paenibacillus dakarensis]|uniref:YdeI/OmpD-associated family protein n=1 Tax=Paenibacillus dakarensis TaxID=1527293 RepID=UPI0006D56E73|nr:YdeI/OmpD-associated family protein [Paenibacillus dakarensis]
MKSEEGKAKWPLLLCENQKKWEAWLSQNYDQSQGVKLQIAKKNSALSSVSYAEALDIALCYGWIDSRKESLDENSWIQRFGPRGKNSIWSQVNKEKVQRLIEEGRMKPPGLQAVETAKINGRWETAYAPPSRAVIPEELEATFADHPCAREVYESLSKQNQYAIHFRIQNAKKAETRERKAKEFIQMLESGKQIHPLM